MIESKRFDIITFVLVLSICSISLIALYSLSFGFGATTNYFYKQLTWVLIGIAFYLALAILPIKQIINNSYAFYGLIVISLILVYLFGNEVNGSRRWFMLGPIKLQPSEPAKIITIIALAKYVADSNTNLTRFKDLGYALLIIGLPFILINIQPDLGTSLTFVAIAIPVLFWSGMPAFYVFAVVSAIVVLISAFDTFIYLIVLAVFIMLTYFFRASPILKAILIFVYLLGGYSAPIIWEDVLKPHQRSRILTLFNPSDVKGSGYQVHQSKIAIGSGGDFGKGLMKGTQVQLGLVPEVHSDLIVCVIAEEFGFVGISVTIGLFAILIIRLIYYAMNVKSKVSSVTLIAVATLFLYHVFTNMGMAIGIMPVTGLPLPFLSYGGSAMITNLMVMGICSNFMMNKFES